MTQKLSGNEPLLKRYPGNPVIPRNAIPCSDGVLNSSVIKFGDEYRGIFTVTSHARGFLLHAGRSKDGINWDINHNPIQWKCKTQEISQIQYSYDPRIVFLEGKYYMTWCNGYHGPSIALGVTENFENFELIELVLPPCNRNAVLFPRKISGKYVMFHRPSDMGHTLFGDIFLCFSNDLIYWGQHRFVMGPRDGWQSLKVGAGPVPVETDEGWVLIYHGVMRSCNGCSYYAGAAILDLEEPWKVLYRTRNYILGPTEIYECVGNVPNVTFPVAAVHDEQTDELRVYYGAADTCVGIATCKLADLIHYIKENSYEG